MWYQTENRPKKLRQVVLTPSDTTPVESRFGMLFLAGKYMHLLTSERAVGFFGLDSDGGPFLMVRGDGIVNRFRGSPVRVSFGFYQYLAGGLLVLVVDVTDGNQGFQFEGVFGLDTAERKALIRDALSRDTLHLCFAEGDGAGTIRNGVYSGSAINARFDVVIPFPEDCRSALRREWEQLLDYHAGLSASRRDFHASTEEWQRANPVGTDMILPEIQGVGLLRQSSSLGDRPWWKFWG